MTASMTQSRPVTVQHCHRKPHKQDIRRMQTNVPKSYFWSVKLLYSKMWHWPVHRDERCPWTRTTECVILSQANLTASVFSSLLMGCRRCLRRFSAPLLQGHQFGVASTFVWQNRASLLYQDSKVCGVHRFLREWKLLHEDWSMKRRLAYRGR